MDPLRLWGYSNYISQKNWKYYIKKLLNFFAPLYIALGKTKNMKNIKKVFLKYGSFCNISKRRGQIKPN